MVLHDRAAGASRRRPLGPISPNVDGRPSDPGAPDGFKVNRPKRSPHASLVEKLASQGAKSAANAVAASSAAIKSKRKAQQEKLASQGAKSAANAQLLRMAPGAAPAPAPSPPASTTAAATTPTTTPTTTAAAAAAAAAASTSTATLKIGSLSASSLPFQPLPYSTRKSSPNSTLSMAASRLAELAACSAATPATAPATAPAEQTASASASVASCSPARAPPPCTPPSAGHSSAASDVSALSVVSSASAVSTASRVMDGYFDDAAVLIQGDFEELRGAQAKELERLKASHQRTVAELTSFRNWCVRTQKPHVAVGTRLRIHTRGHLKFEQRAFLTSPPPA